MAKHDTALTGHLAQRRGKRTRRPPAGVALWALDEDLKIRCEVFIKIDVSIFYVFPKCFLNKGT